MRRIRRTIVALVTLALAASPYADAGTKSFWP